MTVTDGGGAPGLDTHQGVACSRKWGEDISPLGACELLHYIWDKRTTTLKGYQTKYCFFPGQEIPCAGFEAEMLREDRRVTDNNLQLDPGPHHRAAPAGNNTPSYWFTVEITHPHWSSSDRSGALNHHYPSGGWPRIMMVSGQIIWSHSEHEEYPQPGLALFFLEQVFSGTQAWPRYLLVTHNAMMSRHAFTHHNRPTLDEGMHGMSRIAKQSLTKGHWPWPISSRIHNRDPVLSLVIPLPLGTLQSNTTHSKLLMYRKITGYANCDLNIWCLTYNMGTRFLNSSIKQWQKVTKTYHLKMNPFKLIITFIKLKTQIIT